MKDRLLAIAEVAFIALFIFSFYKLVVIGLNYKRGDDIYNKAKDYIIEQTEKEEHPEGYFEINLSGLQETNPDIIGWIRIPGTALSYPLLQPDNNEYYLKHTYNNIYSDFGSVFIDANCNMGSANTIIYGHNMKNQSMFGTLRNYFTKGQEYLEEHPYIYIVYNNAEYRYQIISAIVVETDDLVYTYNFFSDEDKEAWFESISNRSLLSIERENGELGHFITLSTCTSRTETERRVIIAEQVERLY